MLPAEYGPSADPQDGPAESLSESIWIDPYPDGSLALQDGLVSPHAVYEQREGVELAFIAALQHLPARQRAVLILRDVLGFSAREVGEVLHTTPTSVDSALQRAHRAVDARLPERSQQETLRSLGDGELRALVNKFVAAWERADVDAVVDLLTEDAALAMPPDPTWLQGREAVAAFLTGVPLTGRHRWRLVRTRANGQPAFGAYVWDGERETFAANEIIVLTLEGPRIAEITAFRSAEPFARFGLPSVLEPRQ
jgi:RNA polymerase sigma-70 factor, ECF subfamily